MQADGHARFAASVLPHLDAAYNLARWLVRHDADAQDAVHDAFVRAARYIDTFRGDNARAWLLQIVRNTCYTWLRENRPAEVVDLGGDDALLDVPAPAADEPPAVAARKDDRARIDAALGALPFAFREVVVLRELEDLAYKDIARVVDAPIGTVMSRLSRARRLLADSMRVITRAARPQVHE